MPFKSEAQRRYLWANEPEIARDWTDTYGSRIQKNTGGITRIPFQGGGADYSSIPDSKGRTGKVHSRPDRTDPNPEHKVSYSPPSEGPVEYIGGQKYPVVPENKNTRAIAFAKSQQGKRKNKYQFINKPADYPSWVPKWAEAVGSFNRKPNRRFLTDKVLRGKNASKLITDVLGLDDDGLSYTVDQLTPDQLEKVYASYMPARMSGEIDAYGNPNPGYDDGGGGQQQMNDADYQAWLLSQQGGGNVVEDVATDWRTDPWDVDQTVIYEDYGRIPAAFGGIMDTNTGRRAYGLGSLFKSVKKAAKKVLKSPLGKAAVLGLGAYYMPGFGIKATGGFSNMFQPSGFFGKALLNKDAKSFALKNFNPLKAAGWTTLTGALMGTEPKQDASVIGNRGGSLIDPLTGKEAKPAEMVASFNSALENAGGDPDKIAAIKNAYRFLGPDERLGTHLPYETYGVKDGGRIGYADAGKVWGMDKAREAWNKLGTNSKLGYVDFVDFFLNGPWGSNQYRTGSDKLADGGRIGAQEGGLMDLGGMEKDYRNNGGFVALGGEERADDVPARLSRNEFVFTADAVRGAGGGDIDKGAEIMENVMKNLEQGGKISEETQGNAGAQEMFSVSERIGEVI